MPGLATTTIAFDDQRRWETPPWVVDAFADLLGVKFIVDVCGSKTNKKAPLVYTEEMNCLSMGLWRVPRYPTDQQWAWMNPPYNKPERACKDNCTKKICEKRGYHLTEYLPGIDDFVEEAYVQSRWNGINVVGLLPGNIDTGWFHKYISGKAQTVYACQGRIAFELDGVSHDASSISNMLVVWRAGRNGRAVTRLRTFPLFLYDPAKRRVT